MMFSATFPKGVRAVAKTWLAPKPAIVKIEAADRSGDGGKRSSEATTAIAAGGKDAAEGVAAGDLNVDQTVHVCAEHKKGRKLLKHITELRKNDARSRSRVLVFANRIKTVNFVGDMLKRHGEKCITLHGELKQERRDQALKDFKSGKSPVLVAHGRRRARFGHHRTGARGELGHARQRGAVHAQGRTRGTERS